MIPSIFKKKGIRVDIIGEASEEALKEKEKRVIE